MEDSLDKVEAPFLGFDSSQVVTDAAINTAEAAIQNEKIVKMLKNLELTAKEYENFDPIMSNRERRKLTKRIDSIQTRLGYSHDETGQITGFDQQLCDCLSKECPGCYFPCVKCQSPMCSEECRNGRKFIIEEIENEADRTVIRNPALPLKNT